VLCGDEGWCVVGYTGVLWRHEVSGTTAVSFHMRGGTLQDVCAAMPPLQRVLLHQGRPYGAPVQLALNSDHVPPVINKGCQCDSQGGRLRELVGSPTHEWSAWCWWHGTPHAAVHGARFYVERLLLVCVVCGVTPIVRAPLSWHCSWACSRVTPVCTFVPCSEFGAGAAAQLDCPTMAACQQQECGQYSGRAQHSCLCGTLACAETVSLWCCCVWWAAGVPAAVTS
jgi:hypothetical protein